jgi:hypothetical protein
MKGNKGNNLETNTDLTGISFPSVPQNDLPGTSSVPKEQNLEDRLAALKGPIPKDGELEARLEALKGPVPTEKELQDRLADLKGAPRKAELDVAPLDPVERLIAQTKDQVRLEKPEKDAAAFSKKVMSAELRANFGGESMFPKVPTHALPDTTPTKPSQATPVKDRVADIGAPKKLVKEKVTPLETEPRIKATTSTIQEGTVKDRVAALEKSLQPKTAKLQADLSPKKQESKEKPVGFIKRMGEKIRDTLNKIKDKVKTTFQAKDGGVGKKGTSTKKPLDNKQMNQLVRDTKKALAENKDLKGSASRSKTASSKISSKGR